MICSKNLMVETKTLKRQFRSEGCDQRSESETDIESKFEWHRSQWFIKWLIEWFIKSFIKWFIKWVIKWLDINQVVVDPVIQTSRHTDNQTS